MDVEHNRGSLGRYASDEITESGRQARVAAPFPEETESADIGFQD